MIRRRRKLNRESICLGCINSVPCVEDRRGCEWSIRYMPVPGWKAVKTGTSYLVSACPKYRKDEK